MIFDCITLSLLNGNIFWICCLASSTGTLPSFFLSKNSKTKTKDYDVNITNECADLRDYHNSWLIQICTDPNLSKWINLLFLAVSCLGLAFTFLGRASAIAITKRSSKHTVNSERILTQLQIGDAHFKSSGFIVATSGRIKDLFLWCAICRCIKNNYAGGNRPLKVNKKGKSDKMNQKCAPIIPDWK
jgi:hypothetical protein